MAKMRKVTVVRGVGEFVDPYHVTVQETSGGGRDTTGKAQTVKFRHCIIAAGSQAVHLPFMPKDPRVVDSTGALALAVEPKRMLILGGGIFPQPGVFTRQRAAEMILEDRARRRETREPAVAGAATDPLPPAAVDITRH